MACFVPFNNRNLDVSFFVFKPTIVLVDELVEALKQFSLCTETLGCLHSAIFRSIHGNMIIWYGAWMKRSDENKELLKAALIPMLTNVSSMAILMDTNFLNAYAGESKDGSAAAKFSTGDTVSLSAATHSTYDKVDQNDFSYAMLAIFKSHFLKMDGAISGVCLKCNIARPRDLIVVNLYVWKSLHSCYSYLLNSDYRKDVLPYLKDLSLDVKYDMFRVVYVSGDQYYPPPPPPPPRMLENDVQSNKEGRRVVQE